MSLALGRGWGFGWWAWRGWLVGLVLAAAVLLLGVSAPAALADSSWSGGAAVGSSDWSSGSNWSGGVAPTPGTAGMLTFPDLSSCDASTDTCEQSYNDLTGVSASGITIDDSSTYDVGGNAITLGSGGFAITGFGQTPGWGTPITLGADQTWAISDGNSALSVTGAVTGQSHTLGIVVNGGGELSLSGADEVGAVSISGQSGQVELFGNSLNATDGNPIDVTGGASLGISGSVTSGPVAITGGSLVLGGSTLSVSGTASFDSASTAFSYLYPTTSSLLTASGDVSLAGTLNLIWAPSSCAALTPGTVYSLVKSTAGTLTGTFSNVPDGSILRLPCGPMNEGEETVRIHSTSTSVTATALATPSLSLSAPSSGTAGSAISSSSVSAALSGGSSPSGTVTFKVFGPQSSPPSDCSGGSTVGTAPASGNHTYSPSHGFTPAGAGDYWWYASYGGDSTNTSTNSLCGTGMSETVISAHDTVTVGRINVSGPTARVPLACPGTARTGCQTRLTLETTNPASSLHVVIVGRASASLASGQTKTVEVKLNEAGKRLLARRHSLQTKLLVTQSGELVARKIVWFRPM